jgi:hypothetical protein
MFVVHLLPDMLLYIFLLTYLLLSPLGPIHKVKTCLAKERVRQTRKRKHEERAIRMGWKQPPEEPEAELVKADPDAVFDNFNQ